MQRQQKRGLGLGHSRILVGEPLHLVNQLQTACHSYGRFKQHQVEMLPKLQPVATLFTTLTGHPFPGVLLRNSPLCPLILGLVSMPCEKIQLHCLPEPTEVAPMATLQKSPCSTLPCRSCGSTTFKALNTNNNTDLDLIQALCSIVQIKSMANTKV